MAETTTSQSSGRAIFVGRQPIFDRAVSVFAYELLFRGSKDCQQADVGADDGDRATAMVFVNTFMELGLQVVTGNKPAFVNLTRTFIEGDFARLFPPQTTYLEVLETITVDPELLTHVRRLAADGYRIALDDFEMRDDNMGLLEFAGIVKLDVKAQGMRRLRESVAKLRPYGIPLLAEKIETHEEFHLCRDLGFQYFQGFFLSRPQVIAGYRLPTDRLAMVQVLAKINDPNADVGELDALVSKDVSLSYKLLKYINSANFALATKIHSVHQALVLLGKAIVKEWVSLVILSGMTDKPHELLVTALLRAKMCECLGREMRLGNREEFFTTGLFSTLDALLDCSLDTAVEALPLTEEMKTAITKHDGILGEVLACVIHYERGAWENVRCGDLSLPQIRDAYFRALRWISQSSGLGG